MKTRLVTILIFIMVAITGWRVMEIDRTLKSLNTKLDKYFEPIEDLPFKNE